MKHPPDFGFWSAGPLFDFGFGMLRAIAKRTSDHLVEVVKHAAKLAA
jgi:hypothetical protein